MIKYIKMWASQRNCLVAHMDYSIFGELRRSWLVPVESNGVLPAHWRGQRLLRHRNGGVNVSNLRSLKQDKCMDFSQVDNTISVKMALINARSMVNKTFILNDYCSSNNLDFLFVTETWLDALDLQ